MNIVKPRKNNNLPKTEKLIEEIIDEEIINKHIENITLEVSSNNISAINLYKKLNFKEVAIRKNYYNDSDAILMLKEIR